MPAITRSIVVCLLHVLWLGVAIGVSAADLRPGTDRISSYPHSPVLTLDRVGDMVKTDVVLFFSPSCPFCNAFYRDLMTAVKDGAFSLSGKRVTIIMFSRNAADVSASKNLLCVGHLSFPAAYHEYQSTTFRRFYGRTYESGWAEKTSASIAVKYGATPESLLRCQSDLKLQAVVSLFHKVGSSYSQTLPFVLINGKKAPIDEFRRLRRELS